MENMDTVAQPSRAAISLWPDELLDAVFRTVDYKTFDGCVLLRTCSLVCRRWRPLAQHYTFRYLCLRLILKDRSLTAFYRFLNASPHICSHVRDLAILSWNFRIILTIDLRFLRRLLLLLPRLESFSLDNYRLECNGQLPNSPFPTTVDPRQLFSTEITHDITATGLPFYDGFLALLRLFPAVDVLKLGSIRPARLASILDEDITHGAPYPPIKRLAVEVTSDLGFWEGGKLAEILAPSNNLNTLRAVELECRSLHGLVGCNAILSQLPRALDELEISVYLSPSSLANNETLENLTTRLSTFTSLHCFAFVRGAQRSVVRSIMGVDSRGMPSIPRHRFHYGVHGGRGRRGSLVRGNGRVCRARHSIHRLWAFGMLSVTQGSVRFGKARCYVCRQ
ncbi:hypothetical protein BDW22DRAFT_1262939 [Trametopsis cervina]|nr:hypothetical protein BDW22DRAFT_1262939 [Trametopsis cervina]